MVRAVTEISYGARHAVGISDSIPSPSHTIVTLKKLLVFTFHNFNFPTCQSSASQKWCGDQGIKPAGSLVSLG